MRVSANIWWHVLVQSVPIPTTHWCQYPGDIVLVQPVYPYTPQWCQYPGDMSLCNLYTHVPHSDANIQVTCPCAIFIPIHPTVMSISRWHVFVQSLYPCTTQWCQYPGDMSLCNLYTHVPHSDANIQVTCPCAIFIPIQSTVMSISRWHVLCNLYTHVSHSDANIHVTRPCAICYPYNPQWCQYPSDMSLCNLYTHTIHSDVNIQVTCPCAICIPCTHSDDYIQWHVLVQSVYPYTQQWYQYPRDMSLCNLYTHTFHSDVNIIWVRARKT